MLIHSNIAYRDRYSTYLKLYNYCLNEMEPLTYRAFIRTVVQVRKNERLEKIPVLRKDPKAIGLVFEKFMRRQINFSERKSFLKELYVVLGYRYSMKIFVTVPNYLHLLHDLLNLDPNGDASDGDVRATVQKILRKFINFALFEDDQQRVFDLIALIEFSSYSNSIPLRATEQISKRTENLFESDQKTVSQNFFKLLKPIEFTMKEYREKSQKKLLEESKMNSEIMTEKKLESYNTKKSIVPNICQFVYYLEYFLLKIGATIEQDEVQIVQFISNLFDFLYETQILHLIYPPMKSIPSEINSNVLMKKYESVCHRNGGPLISMLTIIFTVLRNAKIIPEKVGLLKCCAVLLGLQKNDRTSDPNVSRHGSGMKDKPKDGPPHPLKELMISAIKRYPGSEVKKDMSTSLVDSANADKLPDLLVQKVIFERLLC